MHPLEAGTTGRPQFTDIDAWGLTHTGHVRPDNQDHFFVGGLARFGSQIEPVSISDQDKLRDGVERVASLGIVADGAGGASDGREAAHVAVRELIAAVARFFEARPGDFDADDPDAYSRLLQHAALSCHEALVRRGRAQGGRQYVTTLTLFLGLWPHAYLLQVGDSRCYVFMNGVLTQITRDQTIAQDLVDSGVISRTTAEKSRWAHVLSSAIGGTQAMPVVTRVVRDWGAVILLCSDGLTRHVADDRIRERLASMTSARQVAEQLVKDALDGGGSDNITVLVGRTVAPAG